MHDALDLLKHLGIIIKSGICIRNAWIKVKTWQIFAYLTWLGCSLAPQEPAEYVSPFSSLRRPWRISMVYSLGLTELRKSVSSADIPLPKLGSSTINEGGWRRRTIVGSGIRGSKLHPSWPIFVALFSKIRKKGSVGFQDFGRQVFWHLKHQNQNPDNLTTYASDHKMCNLTNLVWRRVYWRKWRNKA